MTSSQFELFKNLSNSNVHIDGKKSNELDDFLNGVGDDEVDLTGIRIDNEADDGFGHEEDMSFAAESRTVASQQSIRSVQDMETERIQKDFYLQELRASNAPLGGVNMDTPLSELKFLWQRQKNLEASNTSVAFMQDVARIGFTGLEFGNRWLNSPIRLDGFAAKMQSPEQMKRLEGPLRRLHQKYFRGSGGGGSMNPILEIVWIIASTAFMHHFMSGMETSATTSTFGGGLNVGGDSSGGGNMNNDGGVSSRATMPSLNL